MNTFMAKPVRFLMAVILAVCTMPVSISHAGPDPFIGEIGVFGTNFCPRGWVDADGQLLKISENEALFSLLGTIYGGDGRTTFALPDLRGRTAVHHGAGPGLNSRKQGDTGEPAEIEYAPGNGSVPAGSPFIVLRYCIAYQGIYPSRN